MFNISTLALKFAPWSISKAGAAETCPAQFKHKYVLKTPEESVPSGNRVGTAAHTILEERVGGKSAEEAKAIALEKTPLTSNEQEDLHMLAGPIEAFLVRFNRFCVVHGVTEILREVEWGITKDYLPTGFFATDVFFRGKIDLGVVTREQDLVVIDHKSGVARDLQNDVKKKHQLYAYAALALPNVAGLAGVRGGINFLQGPEEKRLQWIDYIEAARIRSRYAPWLFEHLNFCAEALVEPFTAKPKRRWPCEWCGYRNVCAAYAEMTRGSET